MRVSLAIVSLIAFTACRERAPDREQRQGSPALSAPAPIDSTQWMVTEYGIGPIRAGMRVATANAQIAGFSSPATADSSGCDYAVWKLAPHGVAIMVENGRIVRVDVREGVVATAAGATIGDTEARIHTLYASRVITEPHRYEDAGHYLIVTPENPADSAFRLVFETDGKRVTRFRGGLRPAVQYVEGCG